MIIEDDKHLMFIEPKATAMEPSVQDDLTQFSEWLQATWRPNDDATRGWHTCSCKAHSDNKTFSVELAGSVVTTNSLLAHYVKNHRSEVPEEELAKLRLGMDYVAKHSPEAAPHANAVRGKPR